MASEGQELFRLIRQSRLEWRGQLTAAQAARLRGQEAVELQLPDDSTAQARLRAVSPGFDTQTRLLTVYADVLPGSSARAGMYAGGRILLDVRPAIAVPAASIVIRDGRSHVFVLSDQAGDAAASGEAVARQTPVRTGRRQEGWIEVLDALAEDAQVVADGAGLLQDGDRVRVAAGARREE